MAGPAAASVITIPPDLNPGDPYRLVFITGGTNAASSTDISVYNAFVTSQAGANPTLVDLGTTWYALGSTTATNARQNTATGSGGGVPVYRLDGVRIADDYADLWDGTLDAPLFVDQFGSTNASTFNVWTGSDPDGTIDAFGGLGNFFAVAAGSSSATNGAWMSATSASLSEFHHFYAMSGILTVPEPGAMVPIGLVGLLCVGMAARRRM